MAQLRQHRVSTSFFEDDLSVPPEILVDPLENTDGDVDESPTPVPSANSAFHRHRGSVARLQRIASYDIQDDSKKVADSFVFAFDIDGVLVRGGSPIPEAIEAMNVLHGENEYNIVV